MLEKKAVYRLLAVFISLTLLAGTACIRPPIARTWINPTAKLHDITKIDIIYNCGEKPIKAYDPLSASLWIIKAHTRCARTNCTWGRAKATSYKDGSMAATFNTFSAIRTITIFDEGGLLRLKVHINYRDERRQQEVKTYYLQPEGR